jgi:hypothetical protein
VEDILFISLDGLTGLEDAIKTILSTNDHAALHRPSASSGAGILRRGDGEKHT